MSVDGTGAESKAHRGGAAAATGDRGEGIVCRCELVIPSVSVAAPLRYNPARFHFGSVPTRDESELIYTPKTGAFFNGFLTLDAIPQDNTSCHSHSSIVSRVMS